MVMNWIELRRIDCFVRRRRKRRRKEKREEKTQNSDFKRDLGGVVVESIPKPILNKKTSQGTDSVTTTGTSEYPQRMIQDIKKTESSGLKTVLGGVRESSPKDQIRLSKSLSLEDCITGIARISTKSAKPEAIASANRVSRTVYNNNHRVSKSNAEMIAEASSLTKQEIDFATTTVTYEYLQQMIQNIKNEKIKTLAYWRIQNPEIVSTLEDFCNLDDDKVVQSNVTNEERIKVLIEETQTLFDHLNPIMAKQENFVKFFPEQQIEQQQNDSLSETSAGCIGDEEIVAIVFGGKEANPARSLSEVLVEKLSQTCLHVYTVSRSNVIPTKSNITHYRTHELAEDSKAGVKDFADVITQVINDYFSRNSNYTKRESESNNNRLRTLVIYFTIGFFKGKNFSQKNIISAKNFSNALSQVLSSTNTSPTGNNWGKDLKWKVIVTGTDATLPSQTPDQIADWRPEQKLTTPSYRISKYNFVYAMSKLGQYYIIATTISTIINTYQPKRVSEIVENLTQNIVVAGSDIMYNEENVGVNKYISMPELDGISFLWTDAVQPSISSHLAVANDLTIVYTPLHCKNWVTEAVTKRHGNDEFHGSIRSNIVYQVVRRLKNAISLDMAARCHLRKMN